MRGLLWVVVIGCKGGEPVELPEFCDGIDNDYDGLIDEDLPDGDGDGIIDCMDDRCGTDAGPVEVSPTCEAIGGDPWAPTVLWRWGGLAADPTTYNVAVTPSVANLDDDNGDGDIDAEDVPDVVFVAFGADPYNGTLVVLDGATGAEKWSLAGFDPLIASVALGDVDDDGRTDLVLADAARRAIAISATGATIWTSADPIVDYFDASALADLDGDGTPEVVAGNLVLAGPTGELLFTLDTAGMSYGYPAVVDLDDDGVQEILIGHRVFDGITGAVRWEGTFSGTYGQWPAIVDVDPSPGAEVVLIGGAKFGLWTADGAPLVEIAAGTVQTGGPCVADFDGDGTPDIAWADPTLLMMFHLDGTRVWTSPIGDPSGLASCAAFDLDGDGASEILFADQETFYILDGQTGTARFAWSDHASATYFESPSVADLDGDGSAEILLAGNELASSGTVGITVFTQPQGAWSKVGPTWSQHDDSGATITDAGEIPARPTPAWQTWNGYRGRPGDDHRATDLVATIAAVCFDNCSVNAGVTVAVHIANVGGSDSKPGVPVTLYRREAGALVAIQTRTLEASVLGGTGYDGLIFQVTSEDFDAEGLVVGIDDDGAGGAIERECDETNNQGEWTGPSACP